MLPSGGKANDPRLAWLAWAAAFAVVAALVLAGNRRTVTGNYREAAFLWFLGKDLLSKRSARVTASSISRRPPSEAVDRALRNEVMIFVVGLGAALARDARRLDRNPDAGVEELDFYGRMPLFTVLRRMAKTTGGRDLFSSGPAQLRKSFQEVAEDLRHQYSLAYLSDDPSHDGTWRRIVVSTRRPGVKIIHRSG